MNDYNYKDCHHDKEDSAIEIFCFKKCYGSNIDNFTNINEFLSLICSFFCCNSSVIFIGRYKTIKGYSTYLPIIDKCPKHSNKAGNDNNNDRWTEGNCVRHMIFKILFRLIWNQITCFKILNKWIKDMLMKFIVCIISVNHWVFLISLGFHLFVSNLLFNLNFHKLHIMKNNIFYKLNDHMNKHEHP